MITEPGLGAFSRLVLNHICIFSIFRRSDNGRLSVIHENPRNTNNLIDNPRCKLWYNKCDSIEVNISRIEQPIIGNLPVETDKIETQTGNKMYFFLCVFDSLEK